MANTIKWKNYTWLTQHKWGNHHPSHFSVWYGKESIKKNKNEILELNVDYDPRNIKEDPHYVSDEPCDMDKPFSSFRCGLIRTKEEFSYGDFYIRCKLPKGKCLWPSFWFGTDSSWPPEIDVMEGYTGYGNSYKYGLFKTRIEPNVHYTSKEAIEHPEIENKPDYMVGPKRPCRCIYNLKTMENEFLLKWRPDSITIYHNGKRVMKVKDKNILSQFNGKMIHPIINLSVEDSYKREYLETTEPFIIYDFYYEAWHKD